MTKTTEELKHSMYHELKKISGPASFDPFQSSLEAYLEALRQEAIKGAEKRDQLRNRLQAFEFANKSAGEFLQEAQAKVKRQRQSIGKLKNDRDNARNLAGANYTKYQKVRQELSELRKEVGAIVARNRRENASEDECDGIPRIDCRSSAPTCAHNLQAKLIFDNHIQHVCMECSQDMSEVSL